MSILRKIRIETLSSILIFLFLGIFTSRLFLYLDDVNYMFPAVVGDYPVHFRNYINDFGLLRPLDIIYKYIIFTLYLRLPQIAHLIPLVIYTITIWLIYKILLMQKLDKISSFVSSLIIFSMPFAVDGISWLSANSAISVFSLFFLQIYLVEKYQFYPKLIFVFLIFQTISVFMYESTIFMPFLINLYWLTKQNKNYDQKNKIPKGVLILMHSSISILLYLISKILITPQFETRSKLISIADLLINWQMSINQLSHLFSPEGARLFWFNEVLNGFNILSSNPLAAFIFGILLVLNLLYFIFKKDSNEHDGLKFKKYMIFWLTALFLSLLPLGWQRYYLPFRTLLLPISIIVIITFPLVKKIFNQSLFIKTMALGIAFFFLLIQISMITKYKIQYLNDKKIVDELNKKAKELGFEDPYRTNLYIKNLPLNTVGSFIYGDYIYSMFYTTWSTEAFIDLNSGSIKKTAAEFTNGEFSAKIPKNQFLKLKPLIIMSFKKDTNCFQLELECLSITAVLRN